MIGGLVFKGIVQSGGIKKFTLILDTDELVGGDPVYQAYFDNVTYNKSLTTTGIQTDTDTLAWDAVNDVTVTVTRTGNADAGVLINYYKNGVVYGTQDVVTIGNPVNESQIFAIGDLNPGDELKVEVLEGLG